MRCRTSQEDPAAIPDVRASVSRVRYTAGTIWSGLATDSAVEQTHAGTMAGGVRPEHCSYANILCACLVRQKGRSCLRRWLTTSSRTEEIRHYSGIKETGNPCARAAMIRKRGEDYDYLAMIDHLILLLHCIPQKQNCAVSSRFTIASRVMDFPSYTCSPEMR